MLAIKNLNNPVCENLQIQYRSENPAKFGYLKIQVPYLLTSKFGVLNAQRLLADGDLICLHCKPEFL